MKYIFLVIAFLFSACSVKDYEQTQTKIIIIKSPKIKFADVGYIRNSDKTVELELFIAGKSIEKFTINHLICTSEGCMSKRGFNEEYLNRAYPDELLQNILLSHTIYDGKNFTKTEGGFVQHVKDEKVDIIYRVDLHVTYFKDRNNGIILKIKDLDE